MKDMNKNLHQSLTAMYQRVSAEDGDVPGWVMVTLMTAGLVVALSAVALPALTALFNNAISSVSGL